MIISVVQTIFSAFGLIVFLLGIQTFFFVPLTLVYELWKKRALRKMPLFTGMVSILVPAYNEEGTIRASIDSILRSDYPSIEIIVINDGSTDDTEGRLREYIDSGKVRYIRKNNGGKASALNRGIDAASGEVILYTDADSFFHPDTVRRMARWFGDPSIAAVCGNDAPLNPASLLQRFLVITTHIGTGFVRRALSVIGCMPIISGNLGAVRAAAMREIGGFREVWGEDLEITFRLHKYGKRIIFDPDPEVLAECPATPRALWKQRVRWMRSYIKIVSLHRDLFFDRLFRPFSFYLPINFVNMTIVPLIQLALLVLVPVAVATGRLPFHGTVDILNYLGIIFFFCIAIYSILLDRDAHDLVYLPYGLLILPFSYFYSVVTVFSWWKEMRQSDELWEKSERRKVMQIGTREVSGWTLLAAGVFLVLISSAATYLSFSSIRPDQVVLTSDPAPPKICRPVINLALSTHFDAWKDWKDAFRSVLRRPLVHAVEVVGVGAGRPEWAYFKWKGHPNNWASQQRNAPRDLLLAATEAFHSAGFKVAAIIDINAPEYIKKNPASAAIRFDGASSPHQVSLTEIATGAYGARVLAMIEFVARNYPVQIIDLTELNYYEYSFSDADLLSYEAHANRKGWPRDKKKNINKDDPTIWEWKSSLLEGFIQKAATIAHENKKELYVDVPVSWKDFAQNGRESGLDYNRVLNHADKIIVWNYFDLANQPPEASEALARYLTGNFPSSRFYISIGLWGKKKGVGPQPFAEAIASTVKGGSTRIWVTPNDMITAQHWDKVVHYWEK